MKGHGEKITRKQEVAIAALISSPTITAAAKVAGIGETTLWRWLQRKDFQECYSAAKREAVNQAVAQLQQVSSEAVDCLRDVMKNSTKATARVMAAKTVLEFAFKGVELEDLQKRLEELEQVIEERGGAAGWH